MALRTKQAALAGGRTAGVFMLLSALAVSGCSSIRSGSNEVKTAVVDPAPDAGFIAHPERQRSRADLPFQKVWIKPGFDKNNYRELLVAPVNTRYMMEMDWLHGMSSAAWFSDVQADIAELGLYFHDQVVKAFKNDPHHRFRVVERQESQKHPALRLELALIEIDPSTPVLHALSWAGPPGTGTVAGVVNQRRAAFEGRLRDLKTNEIVATFADRDMADIAPIDLTRLTWYGPAKRIMERWAGQFVLIANRKQGEAVTDETPFTVMPF
ncbi:DUF3313 family protein [Candidatus Methylospira mobilis]|nr:DUF3313 family protein [Candidatus Methylospira mobilis]WNV03915.1 DUF3313 family protein [Candidatus Methylospira mobilis]